MLVSGKRNIPNFKDKPEFAESATASDKCTKVDTQDPNKMAVGSEASLAAIIQSFTVTQSKTSHQLIEYIGKAVARGAANVTIGNRTLDSENQQHGFSAKSSFEAVGEKFARANCTAIRWSPSS